MSPSNTGSGSGLVSVSVGNGGKNYLEHQVSKMDTLAGVAIKYGVEVFTPSALALNVANLLYWTINIG